MESFQIIGERLRTQRLFMGLSVEAVAQQIGVSRALLHRYEAGQIVKLDTLERLAKVYNISPSTLLGLGSEYITDGLRFFERITRLEERAERITVVFGPLIYVLCSDRYDQLLHRALQDKEAIDPLSEAESQRVMDVLGRRKVVFRTRRPAMVNILPLESIERYLDQGLAVTRDVKPEERNRLRKEAIAEITHTINCIVDPPMHVHIALTTRPLPTAGYQIIHTEGRRFLVNSPFRLGQPLNLRYGVATITEDAEALEKHDALTTQLWDSAIKGAEAVQSLRELIQKWSP